MKKAKKLRLALLLLPMAALTLASCSDNADDTTNTTPAYVDEKSALDDNMDTSVKPGDDFSRYCWGKWYDNAGELNGVTAVGTVFEAYANTNKKLAALENKELRQLCTEAAQLDTLDMRSWLESCQLMSKLTEQLEDPDALEITKLLGEFYASGRNCMLQIGTDVISEKYYFSVSMPSKTYCSDLVPNLQTWGGQALMLSLQMSGLNEQQIETVVAPLKKEDSGQDADADTQYKKYTSEQIVNAFCESFGISTDQFLNGDELATIILGGRRSVLDMMIWSVATDIVLVSNESLNYLAEANNFKNGAYLLQGLILSNHLLDYPISKEYSEKYKNDELQAKILNLMEELRTTFAKRIDNLEWMSSTTKEAAKKKLAAMKFFAFYPDHWFSVGIPQLTGNSLYEDMNIVRKARIDLQKQLMTVNAREDFLNVLYGSAYPAYEVNCLHTLPTNTVTVLEPFMTSPYYSSNDPEVMLYAVGAVIGHELTHGFDNKGALYGPTGLLENWWTVSDKQEFESRTQLLVDCYNHLPAYQDCAANLFTDGTNTLGENIADLGGLQIALDAYTAKLEQQGVQGDDLAKAQKRFFQAYANLWRFKGSAAYNQGNLKSDHSNNYVRVIGATMNCNRWYELYDVKWGDKNYLKPEKRTHIW